jgi:trans-aconitate methyltransferase
MHPLSFLRRLWGAPRDTADGPFSGAPYVLPDSPRERRAAARWGYRLLLLREPEAEASLEHLAAHAKSAQSIRDRLIQSPEARAQRGFPLTPSLTGDEDAQEIEVRVTPEQEAALFACVEATWRALGEQAPHWSVVTSEDFRPERIGQSLDAFYASGEANVQTLMRTLARNGIDPAALRSCIDFGCGVGRLTAALARHFPEVVGVDVSESHLAVAQKELAARGVGNARFVRLDDVGAVERLPQVQLVYSVIVLQHNPPPVILRLFEGLLGRIAPGGAAAIQLPTYLPAGYRFRVQDYLATAHGDMEMHAIPQHEAFAAARHAGVDVLEVLEDTWTGFGAGARSNTFVLRRPAR